MRSGHRVYIVDDDEAVRHSLSILLETEGYRVASFGAAPDFLAAASSLPAGVLISDIRMPEMGGLELQQHLEERALRFPVILITGFGDIPLAVQAMKAGAVDFIEKPFAAEAIVDAVATAQLRLVETAPDTLTQVAASRLSALSPRERQVLAGLVAGAEQVDCLRPGNQPTHG
jgi:two-component system response regulator FixJ